MKTALKLLLCLGSLVACTNVQAMVAEPPSILTGTGLEVHDAKSLPVLIEELPSAALNRGLTREQVEARVNSFLRKNGIKPKACTADASYYLYVCVNTVGVAFTVEISFIRAVSYFDGQTQRIASARTWQRGSTGQDPSRGIAYILEGVGNVTEVFVNDFLKANQK